jgi:hypothetical protein
MKGWLKTKDALKYAGGISKKTLMNWERAGLRTYRPRNGRQKFYRPADIDRFMEKFPADAAEEIDATVESILAGMEGTE